MFDAFQGKGSTFFVALQGYAIFETVLYIPILYMLRNWGIWKFFCFDRNIDSFSAISINECNRKIYME